MTDGTYNIISHMLRKAIMEASGTPNARADQKRLDKALEELTVLKHKPSTCNCFNEQQSWSYKY